MAEREERKKTLLHLFQDVEKRKQARDLFEESANQGCLSSSYLLWESDRKTDVSGLGLAREGIMWPGHDLKWALELLSAWGGRTLHSSRTPRLPSALPQNDPQHLGHKGLQRKCSQRPSGRAGKNI